MFASQTKLTSTPLWDGNAIEGTIRDEVSGEGAFIVSPRSDGPQQAGRVVKDRPAKPATPAVGTGPSRRQRDSLLLTMTVCEKLSDAVVQNADAAELTRAFAQASGQAVVLLDPDCRPIAEAEGTSCGVLDDWKRSGIRGREHVKMLAKECRQIRVPAAAGDAEGNCWLITPIVAVDNLLGYLLVIGEASATVDNLEVAVAGYVASMFAVTLSRERAGNALGRLRLGDVLDSLVTGHFLDDLDARDKARALGLSDSGRYRIAVARVNPQGAQRLRVEDTDRDRAFARLADTLPYAAVLRGTELVMLIPDAVPVQTLSRRSSGSPDRTVDSLEVLRAQQSQGGELTFGVSEQTQRPEDAPHAMAQAQQAADLGVRLGRAGQTISYENLGIYRLLLQIGDIDQLRRYALDVLGPLMDYDAAHKPNLLHTLSTYLSQHESPKQTARMLRVHVNTVTYRIQRIESLTSLDLADPDDRLSAHVAVKIAASLRAKRTEPTGDDPSVEPRHDMPRVF